MKIKTTTTRRRFLGGTLAAAGALSLPAVHRARAQDYPSRNFRVAIPSEQGGSSERFARAFEQAWAPLLGRQFEYTFHAGAGGQIGYEVFVNQREHDGYNLLFGNMGPEMIMYATQDPDFTFPDDFIYFCRADVDDACIYVRRNSDIESLEQLVDRAGSRAPNVAVTRIPHPASIGVLDLGSQVGVDFNLVPYGGGNPTINAVINGEVDAGAQSLSSILRLSEEFRVIGIFNRENLFEEASEGAPTVNSVFDTNVPDLYSSRGWAVHTRWADENPEDFQKLSDTCREAHASEGFRNAMEQTGTPLESLAYGDREVCTEYALGMIDIATRYRDVITASQ